MDHSPSATERLHALSQDRRDLLELLRKQQSDHSRTIEALPRVDHAVMTPSWAQQRLWFVDQMECGCAAYNIAIAVRIIGSLHRQPLKLALDRLITRHESLRTTFTNVDGHPMQRIGEVHSFDLKEIDLSGYDASERSAHEHKQKREEVHEKFDLSAGPLIRGRLLRVRDQEHLLLITMHHIISDGWSMGVFFRELGELYAAHCAGRNSALEALPIQYADYAQWQRQWLHSEVLARQLNYWRSRLEGAAPELQLPTDRGRPSTHSFEGRNIWIVFDSETCSNVRAFAQRHRMTVFMVLYAAWAILLSRISNQEDVVIGTPIANRQRPELESLIGFFVNTLVLRVAVQADSELEAFLEQVKAVTLGAYENQDVPFERIVEMLQPERSRNRNPIFQTMLALQNAPKAELNLAGLTLTLEDGEDEPAMFDLFVSLEERGDEIVANVNYAVALFDQTTIERWMACFGELLRSMIRGAGGRIGDLTILPKDERHRVVSSFNGLTVQHPQSLLIHEQFEEQARRTPDRIAVLHDQQHVTYAELSERASCLARYLRALGVGPDQLVAICVERSVEMVVAVLGTLKAGGAYAPLDPNYPTERLQYMLEDAAPKVVLTQERLRSKLPAEQETVITLDTRWAAISRCTEKASSATELGLNWQSRVYVIYTSGSTGMPKGTAMTHAAMVNLIEWHRRVFSAAEGKRVLQFSALSFDVAFQEIFSTLCMGDTLVLLDEWLRRDARALMELLIEQSVERLFLPPLMLQSLAESFKDSGAVPTSLQDVITAGEQLRVSAEISSFFKRLRGCRLHNHYGPTESHVVTALTLSGSPDDWPVLPSIGRPLSNTQIYILDGGWQPAPIGVAGEIYIGGANVAREYFKRPALTAQRFIADPFCADAGRRLYRTGDLGRWRADGTLEYLGRNDDQVKIRGYRIELGEIEARLSTHAQVREVAAIVREDVPGEKRLVAYVTRRDEVGLGVEDLRAHLRALVPEHMVPSAFVILESLPLTPSGKLDRRALPIPEMGAYALEAYEAPQGEIEQAVAEIWQELLGVERIGRADNFFELGGHSLLGTRVIAHIRHLFDVELPLHVLFERPTIEGMSDWIAEEIGVDVSAEAL
ncbi:non-ribosomal peptide synthetase [Peristeroidobacter soli]|uniref:non-ribosomal peptide synthetase n=1 Tax=Peristeroidobacter soli TaxID=2497877 RepID=UPI00101D3791|nr:non-ribosomal peptide synthetase [Peristeroidobacter soli]